MSGKRLLKNVLAHTGTLNKMQEEREMWRLRALEKSCRWEDDCTYESRSMLTRGRLLSDNLVSSPSSPPSLTGHHQDSSPERDDHSTRGERREEQTVGYWTRRLLKQEEKDPSRWGHSGYKEIYAEEFASSESENENNERTRHKKERVKKKKVKSDALGSDGTHRKKRKRRRDSSGSSDEERRRKRMKRKKKRDMRKKEKRKRISPTSDDTN